MTSKNYFIVILHHSHHSGFLLHIAGHYADEAIMTAMTYDKSYLWTFVGTWRCKRGLVDLTHVLSDEI